LIAAGGESSDAAAVWRHAAEDCDAADASRIAEGGDGFQIECEQTGRGKVSLEIGRKGAGSRFWPV